MTMHERRSEANDLDVQDQPATPATQPMTVSHESPTAGSDASTATAELADRAGSRTGSSMERSLFADDELAGLRARWDSVQAGFVDDPRECVVKADGLVSDLIEKLTAGFADARSRLEEKWARGETASTEDLRMALQYYREFFQRLLAV